MKVGSRELARKLMARKVARTTNRRSEICSVTPMVRRPMVKTTVMVRMDRAAKSPGHNRLSSLTRVIKPRMMEALRAALRTVRAKAVRSEMVTEAVDRVTVEVCRVTKGTDSS